MTNEAWLGLRRDGVEREVLRFTGPWKENGQWRVSGSTCRYMEGRPQNGVSYLEKTVKLGVRSLAEGTEKAGRGPASGKNGSGAKISLTRAATDTRAQ